MLVRALRWRVALFDGDHVYESRIAIALVSFLLLDCLALYLRARVRSPFFTRTTLLCKTAHAFVTAFAASVLLLRRNYWWTWQRLVLPFSMAYFLADILWNCLPSGNLKTSLHHLVMIGCNYPVGEAHGALVAGAGDPTWRIWLSMTGYLSEWTTALNSSRSSLLHMYEARKGTINLTSGLLILTHMLQLLVFPYLIIFEIIPRYPLYALRQQILTFYIVVLGHFVILQLSIQKITNIFQCGIGRFVIQAYE